MFTGIIETIGVFKGIRTNKDTRLVTVSHGGYYTDLARGESVGVSGVCLTVLDSNPQEFSAQVLDETCRKTTLNSLKHGSLVNLERALRLQDRFGGHFVTGHVDCVGTIEKIHDKGYEHVLTIRHEEDMSSWIAQKGSIAVDGISLTVVNAGSGVFSVHCINHTWEHTNMRAKNAMDFVNIETDILSKYIHKTSSLKGKISYDTLNSNGFLD